MNKAVRRERDAWTGNDGDGGKCEVSGRRKEKLGLLIRKGEEGRRSVGKNGSGTFLLYPLKGNNNYEISIIPLRKKIQDITAFF